ncbi:DEAD/DEAH box helicase family protein [Pasteurella atlantica]|uniref:DEAD/DEAH box helicase family protein n=2 Tax=Pasteurellaceae TaxID=712 RepID=A0ACC6HJ27_9PAST|nr:DEAD/DEAH box helicase family protein [Pasteurella atlantica]MDP8050879.1 DEAD/DEAH box helicase family protein [Pasteurella atlantica]MDP8101699.1 DEAD/DEAH box helicase family protein [Pasteurella atlantica]MDP8104149.1 DEAD/DEAH box helicase family protein [Pasteurella atlantica]MDP8147535.1 DEAD/DEAH box helicase family protein [Pasteurella atlantica]
MRQSQTNEQALEELIENSLLLQGFIKGVNADFNKDIALDEKIFWYFLETTQEQELNKLKVDPAYKQKILSRFDKMMRRYGILEVLKKGLAVDNAHFTFFYPMPLASSGEIIHKNYQSNQFSVTRQVTFSRANPLLEIDMVIFLNGIPLITMELKNHWTGQTAKFNGINQYKKDRDPKEILLNFARCIVHFTLDTDDVFMTTKLNGEKTFFLPFNKGANNGAGNPVNPNGHKTAYLWEDILSKDSLANIITHFVKLDGERKDNLQSRTLFFPRYHQLDVVRKLIQDVSEKGVGDTYLIQHSAGSGKSNSITWCAYQLIETYPISDHIQGSKGVEVPLFDSVIIVTDRRVLDKQLRDNVQSFSEVKNIVAPALSSSELKANLESGKKIILTTIQKFPFIIDGISDLSDKRFAVIIDEAHSSQSGTAHGKMNESLGKKEIEEEIDIQDRILELIKDRKIKNNASYFAFTATPKNTTLEKFGTQQPDGSFKPFHLYSMKQAIEEGFILDVLSNYTTYRSYYEIQKSIKDNPLFDSKKAQKALRSKVEKDPTTIVTKAEIMCKHFIDNVYKTKRLKGKAKAMVVTANIQTAIEYHKAIVRYLDQVGNPFKAVIAFSGKKEIKGIEYTEESINGFASKDISKKFESDEYRILVVANKFLTGFDQPKLTAMYVDKKLQGVLAVQTLSRLNRSCAKLGKKTEDLFILDFYNSIDDIKTSFEPFYTSTSLKKATDVNVLHDLKNSLDEIGVYELSEVNDFIIKYFNGVSANELSPIIDTAAQRFNESLGLEDNDKADYKIKAKQFVKIYGQICSIIPFEMLEWEKLYWFLKFLIPKLIIKDKERDALDELLNSIDLSTYGLERARIGVAIKLTYEETELDPQNPNPRGAYKVEEKSPLDEIIKNFNERWFDGWEATPEEQRVKFIHLMNKVKSHKDYKEKYSNNNDIYTRELALEKILNDVMVSERKKELELYKLFIQDRDFKQGMLNSFARALG